MFTTFQSYKRPTLTKTLEQKLKMITGLLLPIICTLGVLVVVQTPTDLKEIINRLARPCVRPNNLEPSWISCQASLVKSTKWHIHLKKQRASSPSYLCFILISLSADVETNPGPTDYPCGNCALEVCDTDPAINCDSVVSGFIYTVNPLDKTRMMTWLTQTALFPGCVQTVMVQIFQ